MKITNDFVLLGQTPENKIEAIEKLIKNLSGNGKVQPEYLQGMLQRESVENTYLGKGIAIPHGVPESRDMINETSISVMQVPEGIVWNDDGDKAYLIIGIAALGDEHLQILRRLTRLLRDEEKLGTLFNTTSPALICDALNGVETVAVESTKIPLKTLAYQENIVLPNPQGMHARPATTLVKLVKSLSAQVIIQTLDGQQANAGKMFDLLGLGLTANTEITVLSDDEQVLKRVIGEIALGLGDDLSQKKSTRQFIRQCLWEPEGNIKSIQGVGASDGLVIGKVQQYAQQHFNISDVVLSPLEECAALDDAFVKAKKVLFDLMKADNVGSDERAILDAHMAILEDVDMITEAVGYIKKGNNAAKAYKVVSDNRMTTLSAVADSHIAARAGDIRDVRNHVMNALLGLEESVLDSNEAVIICAEDLTPSDTMKLCPEKVLGFITESGGPTGHSAIIARNMGFPAIVAAGSSIRDIANGVTVVIDGLSGTVYLEPTAEQLKSATMAISELNKKHEEALQYRQEKGQTKDGTFIEIAANINEAEEAKNAIEEGAEGVGLMRTEFLYLSRNSIPDEQEQYEKYCAMATALNGKRLIIRTLDIGGDKEVEYLGLAKEDNAFLGVRGIRLCFERPDLFIPQLRAICRAAKEHHNINVMFPMIGKLSDWYKAKELLDKIREEVGANKFPVGVMIEVPSAALMAMELAKHVDFFSVGTNDLTQYTLAMDRQHPILASQTDAMHPSVLRLIDMTVKAAHAHGKWVGVCGGAAGDSSAAKILVGLGVKELSMSPTQIAGVKQVLRQYDAAELTALAEKALAQESAAAVRELLSNQQNGS